MGENYHSLYFYNISPSLFCIVDPKKMFVQIAEDKTPLDTTWLSRGNFLAMATISHTRESSADIRVALVIESGRIKPVWFERTDNRASDRIFVNEICSVWSHHQGSAKIINFAITAGGNGYRLSSNTEEFT